MAETVRTKTVPRLHHRSNSIIQGATNWEYHGGRVRIAGHRTTVEIFYDFTKVDWFETSTNEDDGNTADRNYHEPSFHFYWLYLTAATTLTTS